MVLTKLSDINDLTCCTPVLRGNPGNTVLCCAVPASEQNLKQGGPARQRVAAIYLIIMTITKLHECLMTFD